MGRIPSGFADHVFINCPFDADYAPLFEAIVFCIVDCGFIPRCALEESDSGQVRLEKICQMIEECKYAIHDLSRSELGENLLPRFNMSFELGLDLGCRRFGLPLSKTKKCLIMDAEKYLYQAFLSDLAGHDIKAHKNSPDRAMTTVRNWLRNASRRTTIPGPGLIRHHYAAFVTALPDLCYEADLDRSNIEFLEFVTLITAWLKPAV